MSVAVPEYAFAHGEAPHTWPYLSRAIERLLPPMRPGLRVLDLGCGNGFIAGWYLKRGCRVVGIDASKSGVEQAKRHHPEGRFEAIEVRPDLLAVLGEEPFDLVSSTEVVEHLYAPRDWVRGAFAALRPGGRFICSTPYHGYLKNLAMGVTGKWDSHLSPMWDGGHIKFWSRRTLGALLEEAGFRDIRFVGAGRLPYLWMSMVMSGDRSASGMSMSE